MNKCWHSKKIRRTNGVSCIFSILFSALIIGVFLSIDDKTVFFETPLLFVILIMAFSLAALCLGASFFLYLIYSFIHCRNIILIEYSEEKLNLIQCVYKKEIKDYKTDRWNKYNK